ncbi:MAG: hypothetical protein IT331_07400 [Anaerolineae bacterium]|nr:hypothetical protein [Anaerolineae bacterium]
MSNFKLADNVNVLTDFTDGYTVYDARYALASHTHTAPDHGALSGLTDDDHSQYALLAGRSGGQTLIGGTASGDDLTLQSTNHATKGSIFFGAAGNSFYDEVNDRWGLGHSSVGSGYAVRASQSIMVDSSTNNSGFVARFTGSSSSGVGPQNGFVTNDGAAMASADRIGAFLFNGYDGSAEVLGAAMLVQTTQAWSTTARGTKITFYTTPNSTTTLTAGLVLEQDGTATITNNANVGGEYRVDNTRVVTNRVTGWAAASGTASRATFATGTVTTAQLAQRVKALIDDLMTHGLIGT